MQPWPTILIWLTKWVQQFNKTYVLDKPNLRGSRTCARYPCVIPYEHDNHSFVTTYLLQDDFNKTSICLFSVQEHSRWDRGTIHVWPSPLIKRVLSLPCKTFIFINYVYAARRRPLHIDSSVVKCQFRVRKFVGLIAGLHKLTIYTPLVALLVECLTSIY